MANRMPVVFLSRGTKAAHRAMRCQMKSRKRKPFASSARRAAKLERKLKIVEAQIALLERDSDLKLAVQDHFVLWRRPNLFAPLPLGVLH